MVPVCVLFKIVSRHPHPPFKMAAVFKVMIISLWNLLQYHSIVRWAIQAQWTEPLVLLAIVLSILRFTNSDYPIGIFKLFFECSFESFCIYRFYSRVIDDLSCDFLYWKWNLAAFCWILTDDVRQHCCDILFGSTWTWTESFIENVEVKLRKRGKQTNVPLETKMATMQY
jgi:hypothetical protein